MMPHPQNSAVEIRQMVQWVLSLASDQGDKLESLIPNTEAMVNLGPRPKDGSEANYVLSASYTDRGYGPVGPLSSTSELVLRNPRVEAGDCQGSNQLEVSGTKEGAPQKTLRAIRNGAWASYPQVNLAGINNVTCRASSATQGGKIEFRQGSITGKTLGTVEIPATGGWEKFVEVSAPVKDPGSAFDLYLTFSGPDEMLNLSWFEFGD
jgi:cytochrome c